jgi:hypothetical protein
MPEFLITIPIYHSLRVNAPDENAALDTAERTPHAQWEMDDCQPTFDVLLQNGDVNIDVSVLEAAK